MDTLEVRVTIDPELHGLLVAELTDIGFEAFLESDASLSAYVSGDCDSPELRAQTTDIVRSVDPAAAPLYRVIASRNWNQEWERSMQPVRVGRFEILPPWAQPSGESRIPLWIEPKMSFGTGHHESTRLALSLLESVAHDVDSVLDAGTGTGVLAIAAARLGATRIVAFDIDPWSAENCVENIVRNELSSRIRFVRGELHDVDEAGFDVVLANINKNVLLELLADLAERVISGGTIILSGLLGTDRDVMLGRATEIGLEVSEECTEGEWWATALTKSGDEDARVDSDY